MMMIITAYQSSTLTSYASITMEGAPGCPRMMCTSRTMTETDTGGMRSPLGLTELIIRRTSDLLIVAPQQSCAVTVHRNGCVGVASSFGDLTISPFPSFPVESNHTGNGSGNHQKNCCARHFSMQSSSLPACLYIGRERERK